MTTSPDDTGPTVLIVPERRRPPTGRLRFLRWWKEYLLVGMTLVIATMAVSLSGVQHEVRDGAVARKAQLDGLSRQIDELTLQTSSQAGQIQQQQSQIVDLQRTNAVLSAENRRLAALLRARGVDPASPAAYHLLEGPATRTVGLAHPSP